VLSFGKLGNEGDYDNQKLFAHHFMDLMTEKSNGMITFDFYPGGTLGSEGDMLDQIISGDLDMATLSDGTFTSVAPEISLTLLPFMFASDDEWYAVGSIASGSDFQKQQMETVDSYGLFKYIGVASALYRSCGNAKHSIKEVKDFSDLTFRIQAGDIYTDSYAALGASTATIAFAELYTSLQQGSVDGEDNSLPFWYGYKFYEVEKFVTEMRMYFQTIHCVVSLDCWNDKLTDEDKALFMECAEEAQTLAFNDQKKMNEDAIEAVSAIEGLTFIRNSELTDEAKAGFREAVAPVWEKHSKINPSLYNTMIECIEAARK
jgi:TRAP-type C4-dicarboxylate transport system substrate-binding protein